MGAEVVLMPGTVVCPACASVMHRTGELIAHVPPPETIGMRCLSSRCEEYRRVKQVPLQRVNVEVTSHEPAGLTD